jgi:hypothetical protein
LEPGGISGRDGNLRLLIDLDPDDLVRIRELVAVDVESRLPRIRVAVEPLGELVARPTM